LARIAYLYRWLYYRCYRYSKKVDSKIALHGAIASLYVVIILLINLSTLVWLYVSMFRTTYGIPLTLPDWVIGAAVGVVALWHRYFVRRGNRYKKIIDEFSKESAEEERRGDRLFGWYLAGSFFSFIIAGTLLVLRTGG